MDKEIIRLLNETTYDEKEIEEFMEFAKIDDEMYLLWLFHFCANHFILFSRFP